MSHMFEHKTFSWPSAPFFTPSKMFGFFAASSSLVLNKNFNAVVVAPSYEFYLSS